MSADAKDATAGKTRRGERNALGPVRDSELAHVQQLLAHHAEELLCLAEVRVQILNPGRERGVVPRLGGVVRRHGGESGGCGIAAPLRLVDMVS